MHTHTYTTHTHFFVRSNRTTWEEPCKNPVLNQVHVRRSISKTFYGPAPKTSRYLAHLGLISWRPECRWSSTAGRSLLLQVGLGQALELAGELLQYLQSFLVALVYRTEGLRELSVQQIRGQALTLAELRPVRQVVELPLQVQRLLRDLQELSKILLQLLVNSTPLYNMVSDGSGGGGTNASKDGNKSQVQSFNI